MAYYLVKTIGTGDDLKFRGVGDTELDSRNNLQFKNEQGEVEVVVNAAHWLTIEYRPEDDNE